MNDVFYIFRREFYTIFRDHGVMTFFVLLTLAYPIVYTYIYSNEVVREVQVAVVDHAASPLSREFVRLFEASPNAEVAARCADMEAARELMRQKKVYGILELPEDFNVTAEVPCHVGAEIPVVPYFRPGSKELAEAVVAALKNNNSVLLRKHGQVVCGKDFDQAFERAMFFEMACRIIILSGGKYDTLTGAEIDDLETYVLGKKTK